MKSQLRPGPQLIRWMCYAASPAVLAPVYAPCAMLAGGLCFVVAIIAATEAWYLRHAAPQLQPRLRTSVFSLGEPDHLEYHLSHRAMVPLSLQFRLRLPPQLGGHSTTTALTCPPGQTALIQLPVRGAARGEHTLEPVWTAWTRWGLAEHIAPAGGVHEVTVLPNLKATGRMLRQLDALYLNGMGSRTAPRIGNGREFSRLREYIQGDDLRLVNWKASAKRNQLISTEFQVERAQDIYLVIDNGYAMAAHSAGLTWCDRAVDAAVRLAAFAGRCEDRVGTCAQALATTLGPRPNRGSHHLQVVTSFLAKVTPTDHPLEWARLATHIRNGLRNRSLVVIFTTIPTRGEHVEMLRALRIMNSKHLTIILAFRDPLLAVETESRPTDVESLARQIIATSHQDDRQNTIRKLRHAGAFVHEMDPHETADVAINAYVSIKRRQIL